LEGAGKRVIMPVVKLYANLRKLAGTKELSVSGETLRAALDDLTRLNASLQAVLLENGELRPHVIVTVNGQNLISLDTPLASEDTIAIFPPIAGGSLGPSFST
jgi:sulfur-carrier protein